MKICLFPRNIAPINIDPSSKKKPLIQYISSFLLPLVGGFVDGSVVFLATVAIKIPFRKNSAKQTRNGFCFSEKKCSVCGIQYILEQPITKFRTEWNFTKKKNYKSNECFSLSLNGLERVSKITKFQVFFSSTKWFETKY